jgi:hypothetical protein
MNNEFGGRRSWCRVWSRRAGLLAATVGIVLLAAACGGSSSSTTAASGGAASATAGSGGAASGGVASEAQQLAFARCMRSHGVSNFPDPNPGGGFGGRTQGVQSNPNYQTAYNSCHNLLPAGAGNKGQQNVSQFLQHAQCMRSHGISNYPDPQPGVNPRTALQNAGIDMNSPQFQSASQTCDRLLPQPAASASQGGGA